jgi:hypothetical protein
MRNLVKRYWLLVAAIAVLTMILAAYTLSLSGPVQLTKEEALTLMNLQTRAVLATADRNEYAEQLYLKYGLSPEVYNIDIEHGCFVPRQGLPVEEQNEEDASPTIN